MSRPRWGLVGPADPPQPANTPTANVGGSIPKSREMSSASDRAIACWGAPACVGQGTTAAASYSRPTAAATWSPLRQPPVARSDESRRGGWHGAKDTVRGEPGFSCRSAYCQYWLLVSSDRPWWNRGVAPAARTSLAGPPAAAPRGRRLRRPRGLSTNGAMGLWHSSGAMRCRR